jgi:hypothetical protein
MIEANESTEAAPSADQDALCVPVAALAVDGTNPEAGDMVTISVAAEVLRVEGDCAYVRVETANGEPVQTPKPEAAEDEHQMMLDEAKAADDSAS